MISLNQNELEVLRILWEVGELKPAEIQDHFSWPIDNGTLRSILVNLVEKGHITRKLEGKAFRYVARVPKAAVLHSITRSLARFFSGGSTEQLVVQLVQTSDISPADVQNLRQIASGTAGKKTKRK